MKLTERIYPSASWTAAVWWQNVYLADRTYLATSVPFIKITHFFNIIIWFALESVCKSPLVLCMSIGRQKDDTKPVSLIWIAMSCETLWKVNLYVRWRSVTCMFSVCLLCLNTEQSTQPFHRNVYMDPAQSVVLPRRRFVLAEILKAQKSRTTSQLETFDIYT